MTRCIACGFPARADTSEHGRNTLGANFVAWALRGCLTGCRGGLSCKFRLFGPLQRLHISRPRHVILRKRVVLPERGEEDVS